MIHPGPQPIDLSLRWQVVEGDCLAILPTLPEASVDAVVTDPPYGIGRDGKPPSTSSHGGHRGYAALGWDSERPSAEAFAALRRVGREQVIWGGNYFADLLAPSPGWLIWDKAQRIDQADAELAWTSRKGPVRVFTRNRVEIASDGAVHPTQKPVALMTWCLRMIGVEPGDLICDPYCGSGSTGVAAVRYGCRFLGVEREAAYVEIARRRIAQEAAQGTLALGGGA